MVTSALATYNYTLTEDNRIASVTPRWLAFAQENGASELTEEAVVGKPLSDFVCGTSTQRLYETIYDRVRSDDLVVVLPFRCDSPTLRRDMIMRVGKQPDDILAVQCTLISTEVKRPTPVFDRNAHRDESKLTICSLCLRALVEPVGWLEIEDAAITLHLLEKETVPQVIYSICPGCRELWTRLPA